MGKVGKFVKITKEVIKSMTNQGIYTFRNEEDSERITGEYMDKNFYMRYNCGGSSIKDTVRFGGYTHIAEYKED